MPHDVKKSAWDAVAACQSIRAATAGLDFEAYDNTELVRLATERAFEILGEALKRAGEADPSFKDRFPEMRTSVDMRNRIAHGYDAVDNETVWNTASKDIPPLEAKLRAWLDAQTHGELRI